jgi:hypothetical protein
MGYKNKKESYDDEPVFYCKRCLSLKIKPIPLFNNQDYCEDCGSADIGKCNIEEWLKLYKDKYGHPYV